MSDWTETRPRHHERPPQDIPSEELHQPRRPRRRPKPQRTWPRMVMGALAMYGVFSLVVHAVVAWEVLR